MLLFIAAKCQYALAEEVLFEEHISTGPFQTVVPVTINGKLHQMLLDTGTTYTIVDASLRGNFGSPIGKATLDEFGVEFESDLFKMPKIKLGTWLVPQSPVAVADCERFRALLGSDIQGLLSVKLWEQKAIEFNFDKKYLRILGNYQGSSDSMDYVPLEQSGGTLSPMIRHSIEGVPINAHVDTGANICVGLSHDSYRSLMENGTIVPDPTRSVIANQTLHGTLGGSLGRFTRGQLLGIPLEGLPVNESGNADDLGMLFLVNLNFVIDFAAKRFYFSRNKLDPPIRQYFMLGAALTFSEGHCRVLKLYPGGGAAQEAGIREGDEIMRIAQLSGGDLYLASIYELCMARASETIELEVLRSGGTHTIKTKLKLPAKQYVYSKRAIGP